MPAQLPVFKKGPEHLPECLQALGLFKITLYAQCMRMAHGYLRGVGGDKYKRNSFGGKVGIVLDEALEVQPPTFPAY